MKHSLEKQLIVYFQTFCAKSVMDQEDILDRDDQFCNKNSTAV
jgi:hypothetical protein